MGTTTSNDWWSRGQEWLIKRAGQEAATQRAAHIKAGRSPRTFRYNPPQWHRDMVAALGRNDEEAFKYLRVENVLGHNPW